MLDGHTVPDRLAFVLASHTAVLKQDSPRREAFHCMMEPYVHYVPVARDLGDLEAQLRWALSNASRLRQIATNGGALALRLLSRRAQLCHWAGLIRRLAARTASPVVLDPNAGAPREARPPVMHETIISGSALRPQLTHPQMDSLWTTLLSAGRSGERQRDEREERVFVEQNKTRETTHNRRNPNRQNSTPVLSSVN